MRCAPIRGSGPRTIELDPITLALIYMEIARRAGVSHTTISLSLRNHPSIPENVFSKRRKSRAPGPCLCSAQRA